MGFTLKTNESVLSKEIIQLVVIGTSGTILLIAGIIFFLIRYSNKILKLKLEKQDELIEAEIKGKEAEQNRIARDIHDALGGNLTALNLTIQRMQKTHKNGQQLESDLPKLKAMVTDAHLNVRQVSRDLLANDIEVYGLVYSIRELINHSEISKGSVTSNDEHFHEDIELPKKVAIYRIVQEIMNNAKKHSRCSHFLVDIDFYQNNIELDIEFDGAPFDYESKKGTSEGLGLKNIESRLQFLRGTLKYGASDNRNFYHILISEYEKH